MTDPTALSDSELVTQCCERVLGWKLEHTPDEILAWRWYRPGDDPLYEKEPKLDANFALTVARKLEKDGKTLWLSMVTKEIGFQWYEERHEQPHCEHLIAFDGTLDALPRAICLAALAAVEER